ncbi:MAG: Homocysteine S-methyltransferase [Labilithrix sp.]|nr:Homocysteine S-methyltransferase [Labilithrix sp.]
MLLLDGPMGTELGKRGVETPAPGWSAYAIESHPEVIVDIHAAYARAGARAHRGNTFRTQPRVYPERYEDLVMRAFALLRAGIASGGRPESVEALIGCMAPVEDCYRPYLSPGTKVARAVHGKVASALRHAGFDTLVCETFAHAGEAAVAVEEAVRTGLPTWVALTAGPDATLMTPEAMERAARDCVSAGAERVLVCCTPATKTLAYVERLARIGVAFGAYANAGDPATGLGWDAEPARAAAGYADLAAEWIASGASIVGGCCGTGPAHIAELFARFVEEGDGSHKIRLPTS